MWRFTVKVLLCVCGLFNPGILSSRQARDVGSLLQSYPYNRYLFAHAPKPFYVVIPKQMKKKFTEPISTREHKIGHHGYYEHYQQVTFQIVMDKRKYKMKLERNDGLLSAGIRVKHFEDEQREVISKTVEHCYYHGTIKKDEWSAVAVSTCDGIRGTMHINNETYIIQPLQGGNLGNEYPHLVYKATVSKEEKCGNDLGKWLPFNELHKGEFIRKHKFLEAKRTMGGLKDNSKDKFMKLALVLDHSMYWFLNFTVKHMLEYTIETTNIVDLYYKSLGLRVALTYVELWNRGNRIPVTSRLRESLENFLLYKQRHLAGVDHHAAHLLTRRTFEHDAVGMAIPDSICTNRAGGIDRSPVHLEPQQGATILAHMIGHNLGIKHDEQNKCECSDEFGCIMSSEVLATPQKHSRMFSTCSARDWDTALNMGIAACLTESPQPTFPQSCGNKHVERGEECDCGTPEDCARTDPCCDPYTCLLKSWADCRTGACCYNCTYLSPDYMCRAKSSDCDVPEFCTGSDGQCPGNNYVADGEECNNGTGYCRGGLCPTLHTQCQHIWGPEGTRADTQCYEKFNPTGNFNGHCGKNPNTGWYAECLPDDIQCGLLHCSGGTKEPLYGPDKDSSKTTFTTNGREFECKTVYGPSTLQLPNLGLVLDGTKCSEGNICMGQKCVPLNNLPSLNCPAPPEGEVCNGHGVCTKAGTCFCDDGWGSPTCDLELNTTRTILTLESLHPVAMTTTLPTTTEKVKVIPLDVTHSTLAPSSTTEQSSSAVVQASDSGLLNTKWMMIILASVIGGLALLLAFSFLCYRRRTPGKLRKDQKKKKGYAGSHCSSEEGTVEHTSKLIKFGSLPSYKNEKKKAKKAKKGKKGKKGQKFDDDSDIELPPPPTIISDPNSAKPEKGILKSSLYGSSKYMNMSERRSSESNSNTATSASDRCDLDSVGPYDEIDDDTEAGEIQDIFSGNSDEPERTLDVLDNMIESSSFDFMLPPPFSNMGLLNRSPSPPKGFQGYDIPLSNLGQSQQQQPQRPTLWKSNMKSPPKSRVLRMRNLNELLQNIDRTTIDLSPSPDDPPVQISPSTSEDVRSSSTEDRSYPTGSHEPQSPNSTTSGSTCTALRPLLGSQWSKYILHRNNGDNRDAQLEFDDIDSPLPHINIPPPMNPLTIRSIFNYGPKGINNRDNNDTPLGSQNGECSSNNGTANSRNGYEKSSGYGSEHDMTLEDMSRNQSRSGSASPPNFSAVIRTGPNQIKLVPGNKLQGGPGFSGYSYNPMDKELHKLLEGVPKIDAGSYERSPLNKDSSNNSSNVQSDVGSMDTLKNSILDSSLNSETNTLVNSDYETMDRLQNEERKNEMNLMSGLDDSNDMDIDIDFGIKDGNLDFGIKNGVQELSPNALPNPKPLSELDQDSTGGGPCIDRSLEEISQLAGGKKKKHVNLRDVGRQASQERKSNDSSDGSNEWDPLMVNRYSAITDGPVSVDICEC